MGFIAKNEIMRIEGLPIQFITAHLKKSLRIFHPDKDQNDPNLARELGDDETTRQYVYPELIWRVIEDLYPKLKSSFPSLNEEFLKSHLYYQFAYNQVLAKVQERYGVEDYLTYVDVSEADAQEILDEIISSCDLAELKIAIGGELQELAIQHRFLQLNREDLYGL